MVRDIELPFSHHTRMSHCQLKFLLYLLTKQDGDFKPKWWPANIRFEQPISNLLGISKDSLTDLLKSYYKYKGDSDWLRAILVFTLNLDNLTNETDFTSVDISGKASHKGVEFDIVPLCKNISPNEKTQPVTHIVNNKKISEVRKLNISPAVVEHLKSTKLEYNKMFGTNIDHKINVTNKEKVETGKDIKLCIKESHIKQLMPVASVQLYDVVRYNTVHSKEDFMLKLNLMNTDVLSKLNLLKFRKRLRNTSRDSIKSASEFEKDLIKFKSKPNKDVLKEQTKQKENKKKSRMKIKEKDKAESSNTTTEYMIVDDSPLPLNEIMEAVDDTDMNKENENFENSSKEKISTAENSICSPKTTLPFQPKNNKIRENTDSAIIDLTLEEETPTKINKGTNKLCQFFNMSPTISPKLEKKMKQSSPKSLKRLNRNSMPLMNQTDIKSYFNPIPMKLTPEFIANKINELKKVCRPCFVRLDLVKDLKPIRSITQETVDETKAKIKPLPLPLPIVTEEVDAFIVDLTNEEDIFEAPVAENDCNESINIHIKENDLKLNNVEERKDKVKQKPKNEIKNDALKKKKVIIKVKWPTKRITL